ncbi:MAG: hypothetical protein V7607_6486 [Solirubrobacteraceae bacterium]
MDSLFPARATARFAPVSCPSCHQPAEVVDAFALASTDGPSRHLKVRCPAGHWYTMPADRVRAYGSTPIDLAA